MNHSITSRIRFSSVLLILLALLFCAPSTSKASTLLDNPVTGPTALSAAAPDFYLSTLFQISQTSTITGLNWWGKYIPDLDPVNQGTPTWNVRFFSSTTLDGHLYPVNTPIAEFLSVPTSAISISGFSKETVPGTTASGYYYQYNLPSTFVLQANTPYFVSIQPNFSQTSYTGYWTWFTNGYDSNNADYIIYQKTFTSNPGFASYNMAMQIEGAPVPLPAAVWLLGSGLIGLVGIRRFRK